jgi:hypothetical protein
MLIKVASWRRRRDFCARLFSFRQDDHLREELFHAAVQVPPKEQSAPNLGVKCAFLLPISFKLMARELLELFWQPIAHIST